MDDNKKNSKLQWWLEGLIWGLFMFVIMAIIFPLIKGDGITKKNILISIPLWTIGGLLYGFIVNKIRKISKQKTQNSFRN